MFPAAHAQDGFQSVAPAPRPARRCIPAGGTHDYRDDAPARGSIEGSGCMIVAQGSSGPSALPHWHLPICPQHRRAHCGARPGTTAPVAPRFGNLSPEAPVTLRGTTSRPGARCWCNRRLCGARCIASSSSLVIPDVTVIRIVHMHGSTQGSVAPKGLLQIEDCLDAEGGIVLPPGVTLISLIDRNIANVGDSVAYRYLDYTRSVDGHAVELTWTQLGRRDCGPSARACNVSPRAVTGWRSSHRRASTTSPDSSQRSRRGPLRCRCSRLNCRATPNVSIRRFAMHGPPPSLTTAAAADAVQAFLAKLAIRPRPASHRHR